MKRIFSLFLLVAILMSAMYLPVFAEEEDDDNAMSGEGDTDHAVAGAAWYKGSRYLWKVTLFVGKSDLASRQDSLTADFHRVGTVVMKKTGWKLSSAVKFGSGTKVDYYDGVPMTMDTNPYIISDENCPAIPIASGGDIETVKAYFGSTGTMSTVLNGIADDLGTTKEEMLSLLTFSIGGETKSGWEYEYVAPNATTNRVPWVIVYEPMVILNLKDGVTKLAFTATEFSLCEINGWYDWNKSGGSGQNCSSLPERYLPTSVQLEESWFGYPVYGITDGDYRWKHPDVVKGGGWGMRWLSASHLAEHSYDFSVSNLQVSGATCFEGDTVTITFRSDNWDPCHRYDGIILELLFDGQVIHSEAVDFAPYGGKYHTLTVNVGTSLGTYPIIVRINWENRTLEANALNNVTTAFYLTVQEKQDLAIEAVFPNSDYRAGMTVVTSYLLHNFGNSPIIPTDDLSITFEAYYDEDGTKISIATDVWERAVVPAHQWNLVYFKWTVPSTLAVQDIYCQATLQLGDTVTDNVNHYDTLVWSVASSPYSQTPDTRFEKEQPDGFTVPELPSERAGTASWHLWEYIDGAFIQKTYGIAIAATAPSIQPDVDCPSAGFTGELWRMGSGYGFTLTYAPIIINFDGYTMPSAHAYTVAQNVYATFPEFAHSTRVNDCRTLEWVGSAWVFPKNPHADNSDRLHFTPLWYPNVKYVVSVTASDVWTPAGMISSARNSNPIQITNSAYDDWYVGG